MYTLSIFKSNALMATFFRYGLDKTTGTVNRVRMVRGHGCIGAAHGYGTIGTVPAPKHLPNTRTRTQQRYPIPIPVTVPNNTQHLYPYPTPAPNTRTRTRTYRHDPPYPT